MRKNIRRVLLLVFLAGALFTGWKYCEETAPDMASEKWYEAARQAGSAENTETAGGQGPWEPLPDFDALRASCPDIQAWIRNPGTQLDYPVVQGEDNAYYLDHLPDGTANRNGSVFMDWRNQEDFSDPLTVLYGHHIRGGRMFSSLDGYKEQAYYEEHPCLYLYTPDAVYCVELLAGVILDGGAEEFPIGADQEELSRWLAQMTERSTFQASSVLPAGPTLPAEPALPAGPTLPASSALPAEPVLPARSGFQTGGQSAAAGAEGQKAAASCTDGEAPLYLALCTCTYEYSNARYMVAGRMRKVQEL